VHGRPLNPLERAIGWTIGVPFASWRYLAREVVIRREQAECAWPIEGFPSDDHGHPGEAAALQLALAGSGAAFRRRYRVQVADPLLSAAELMAIVRNDPNVACPLEIARFERDDGGGGPIDVGEEMRVRLPGPWNGPVRVVDATELSFRLATLRGHMEAGEIEFRARDEDDALVFEIESWARSSDPVFDLLYDRLGIGRELQLDMWAFFLERVAQVSGGVPKDGIDIHTLRCVDHPL
jgi:hypothetical protein